MTASADQLQVPCDDALSGGLALTLPAGVNPPSAAFKSSLKGDAQSQQPPCHASAAAEIAALVALATALGEAPHTVCQVLADNVLALLKAGSAGVSVLSVQSDGGALVSWPAIAGRWQAHSGCSRPLLGPAATLEPTAEHCLVVPFGVAGKTAGTVWAVAHDAALGFDAEDLRQLHNLALFAAPALQAVAARHSAPPARQATPALRPHGTPESGQATFDNLIENAPFGVYVVDAKFRLCQASSAARKAFASLQPLIDRDFGDIVRMVWPEPFASEVLAHFRRTLDSGEAYAEPTVNEIRKDTPDIESYDWKIERIVLPDGTFGVVCYFYDLTERYQAAEALRLRTAQFETLVNDAPLGIYLVDAQLRIRQVNPRALPEFGNIEGLIGRDLAAVMQTLWGPARADEIVQRFRHTLHTGEPFEAAELIGLRADQGTIAYYEWQIHRIPLPDGSQGVVCYLRDISARVKAQTQIRNSEEQFRATFENAVIGIVHIGLDHRWLRVNPAMCSLTGYTAEELTAMAFTELTHPDDLADNLLQVQRLLAGEIPSYRIEKRYIHRSGRDIWVTATAALLRDAQGQPRYFIGAIEDITQQKATLELQRRFVERLTHGMPNTLHVFGRAEQRNLWVNRHLGDTLGYSADDIAQMGADFLREVLHPEDVAAMNLHLDRVFESADDEVQDIEFRVRDQAGHWRWLHQSDTVFRRGPDGLAVELVGTSTDVTGRKGIEADLITALAAAEDANQAKSDFLSRKSHELRSPLNAVLGFAQLLQSGTPPPTARQEESVVEILKAGWYLLGLIDEILDLSLIESGRLSCVLEPVPLAEVLDHCQALVEGQAAARGIRLSLPRLDDGCIVIVDRTRLKQVFINILGNAIKYNREGGTVQVHCERVGQGRICIRIEDSGSGLSPDQLDHIFQPFERLGQEAGAIEGSGIGLALSKRLVELMGGRIGVHSVVNQGSVFWVELDAPDVQASAPASSPATASARLRAAVAPGPAAAGRRPCTVLCVEDNRANQLLVQRLLARRSGVRLLLAGDAEQGVQLAHAMQPDVVLMDINLPGMSGLEAMERLAADAATAHIPVIAVSAMAMRHDIDKGLQAGFFRYLSKPIKIDVLTEALDAALALARANPPQAPGKAVAAQPAGMANSARKARKSKKASTP